jgi:hypothetical protein
MVDAATSDYPVNVVFIPDGIVEPFENYRTHPFAYDPTVSRSVECPTSARRRQQAHSSRGQEHLWTRRKMNTACECDVAFPPSQAGAGEMKRREGRRTRRVYRKARPSPIEQVREPAGQPGAEITSETMCVELLNLRIVIRRPDSKKNSARFTRKLAGRMSGIFESLPRLLKEKPMLRIHHLGFPSRNVEESRIKLIDAVKKSSPMIVPFFRELRAASFEVFERPAIVWDLSN